MNDSTVVANVNKRISELEQSIQRLDFVKRHLNQNSSLIKTQIHTSISRFLEMLRNREVFLLDQVDTVFAGKEETLQRQQARLNKALGVLHSSLNHAMGSSDESAFWRLMQALEELNTSDLRADETPYIAFRSDQVALREAILNFGRVDANGMPLMSAFADEDKPSASLPRHVEEYEDSEHHLFYKALQDIKATSSNVTVALPKLPSHGVEDWLQSSMLQLSVSAGDIKTPNSETAGTPMSQTTCAIQNWLSEIKHNPDVEEDDDFEIVDHSGSSQKESPVEDQEMPLVASEKAVASDMFKHIPVDKQIWLLKGGSEKSRSTTEDNLHAYFKHIPADPNMWLATACRQLQNLEELKRGRWFHHIPTETSSWLKRVHDKHVLPEQAAQPDFFSHISRDKSTWLKMKAPMKEEKERTSLHVRVDGQTSFPSYSSTPSCTPSTNILMDGSWTKSRPAATKCWLQTPQGAAAATASAGTDGCKGSETIAPDMQRNLNSNSNSNIWLANPCEEDSDQSTPVTSNIFFSHVSSQLSDWLINDKHHPAPCQTFDFQKNIAKGGKKHWLMSRSFALTENSGITPKSPIESLQESQVHMNNSDWLLDRERHNINDSDSDKSWTVLTDSQQQSPSSSLKSWTITDRQVPHFPDPQIPQFDSSLIAPPKAP